MFWTTSLSDPGYPKLTLRNSKPWRMGRGAEMAFGWDRIDGCISKNSNKSLRKIACSEILLKPERILSIYMRDRENAPVRKVNVPMEMAPARVFASTTT